MGELDLDKIERTYAMPPYKKHELTSVRRAFGTIRPKHATMPRCDLRAAGKQAKNNAGK